MLAHNSRTDVTTPAELIYAVGRWADETDFEEFVRLGKQANSFHEKALYIDAIAKVQDEQLGQRALELALDKEIPPALGARIPRVAAAGLKNADLAWDFFNVHSAQLLPTLDPVVRGRYVVRLGTRYCSNARANAFEALAKTGLGGEVSAAAVKAAETTRSCAALKARELNTIDRWIGAHGTG